jgi:hypothetical protein
LVRLISQPAQITRNKLRLVQCPYFHQTQGAMSDFKFSCPACGQHIACDTSNAGMTIACPACQTALTVPQPPAAAAPAAPPGLSIAASQARHTASEASHSAAVMSRSYAQPQAPGPGGGTQKTSGLAIASLVCSLTFCLGFIPGIICGHLARRNMRRDPSLKGAGFATAGLIISYFTLAFTIGFFALSLTSIISVAKKAKEEALQQQQKIQAAEASAKAAAARKAADTSSGDSLWNLNLTTAQFPDHPAAGKIHGQDFTVERAITRNDVIILRQGQNPIPDLQVIIFTFLKNSKNLAGKTYDISPANADLSQKNMPHVHLLWKEEGSATNKSKIFSKDYAMKLELGAADAAGKIPGKIYLCLPDDQHSYVAGSFDLEPIAGAARHPKKTRQPRKPPAN